MDGFSSVESPLESPLEDLDGVGRQTQIRLKDSGIQTIKELASKSTEELISIPGIGKKTAVKLITQAKKFTAKKI